MNQQPRFRSNSISRFGLLVAVVLGVALMSAAVVSAFQPSDPVEVPAIADEATLAKTLTVDKTFASDTVYTGGSGSFTIVVTNTTPDMGNQNADNVVITDTIDSRFTVTSVDISPTTGNTCEGPGATITCTVGTLVKGASATVTVDFDVDAGATPGQVTNTAYAWADGFGTFSNDDSVQIAELTTLAIDKTFSQSPVNAGADSSFTIVVTNTGTASAVGTLITDTVDSDLDVTGATINPSGSCAATVGNNVSCSVSNLAADDSVTVTVDYTVLAETQSSAVVQNVASASAANANTVESSPAALTITENTVLSVVKTFTADPIDSGTSSSFTIAVTNDGPGVAENVDIVDNVDSDLFVTDVTSSTGGDDCDPAAQNVSCSIPTVDVDETIIITVDFDAVAIATTTVNNSATATDEDGNTDNGSDSVQVQAPALSISKVYQGSTIAGLPVTYTLTYTNSGNGPANHLLITDVLPNNVTFISASDGGSNVAGTITWDDQDLPNLPSNDSDQVTFSVLLGCNIGGSVINDEYQVSNTNPSVTSPPGQAVSFNIQAANIVANFNQSATIIDPGDTVFFSASATTNGPPLSYAWDFGDGGTATGQSVNHTFNTSGEHIVTLTVSDGCSEVEVTKSVLVRTYVFLPLVRSEPEWQLVGSWASTESARSIAVCSTDSNLIFAGTRNLSDVTQGRLRQFNGSTWSTVTANGFPSNKAVVGLAMATNCMDVYAAVSGDGVWHGERAGNVWNWERLGGNEVAPVRDVVLADGRVFAAGSFGVRFWNNGWQSTNAPGSAFYPVMDLAVGNPANNQGPVYLVQWQNRKVWRNPNPGGAPANWSEMSSLQNLPDPNVISVAGDQSNVLFVGTQSNHYRLAGTGWSLVRNRSALSFGSDGFRDYAGYASGVGVYVTSNDGVSFTAINKGWAPPQEIQSLTIEQSTIFAGTTSGVYQRKQ